MRTLNTPAFVFLSSAIVLILPLAAIPQVGVPMLLNFQGELRSPTTGEPVADGSYNMVFRVYDAESGGTLLWQGTHSDISGNPIEVQKGIFSVILGSGTGDALDTSIFSGTERWLEIQVGGEILSPRQRIASVAYSLVSENSRLLGGKESSEFANSTHVHLGEEITSGAVSEARIDALIARDTETDAAIAAHTAVPDAHHAKTTKFSELTDVAADAQIPGAIARDSEIMPTVLGNDGAGSGLDADTLDGMEGAALEESAEIDADIAAHAAVPAAHHGRYTDAEAVAAMGPKSDANPLNHDKTTSLPWGSIKGVPAGFADGIDNDSGGDITGVTAGAGLKGGGDSGGVTLSATFGGTGAASTVARSDHNHDAAYWTLTGNTGTSGANFLGTGDSQPLELRVSGARAMRLEPSATSANIICGLSANSATSGAYGATISGGGEAGFTNRVTDNYGTVGGGKNNQAGDNAGTTADAECATVGGGKSNYAMDYCATVAGGILNRAHRYCAISGGYDNIADGLYSTIGGGEGNRTSADYATIAGGGTTVHINPDYGNRVTDNFGTVGGGGDNQAGDADDTTTDSSYATVSGGKSNEASGKYATVSGGTSNKAGDQGATVGGGEGNETIYPYSTIGGGYKNTIGDYDGTVSGGKENEAIGYAAAVGGGYSDSADGSHSVIAGGGDNGTTGDYATIGGGFSNNASGANAVVCGGRDNEASGDYGSVPGGRYNLAQGDYSFAAGRRAKANYGGCFVWGDSTDDDIATFGPNRFAVRASGGAWFYSNSTKTAGVRLPAGDAAWTSLSDRALKENIRQVDGQEILRKLIQVPISRWSYKGQTPDVEHIGPMAQDFYAAFGLGDDERYISTIDPDGVALAAIQGLYEMLREKNVEIAAIKKQNAELQERLSALEKLFEKFSHDR